MKEFSQIVYDLFKARRDTFGVQKHNKKEMYYYRLSVPLTKEIIRQHLEGQHTIGIYPLLENGTTHIATVDVDAANFKLAIQVSKLLPQPNYIERSRSGNFHVWMFFDKALDAKFLPSVCKEGIEFARKGGATHCGLYPIPQKPGRFGLMIALPFHADKCDLGRTIFVDENNKVYEDQVSFLHGICKISAEVIEAKYVSMPLMVTNDDDTTKRKLVVQQIANDVLKIRWVAQLYEGKGKKGGDQSQSGYDFSFCKACFQYGLTINDTKKLLQERPLLHKKTENYITKTLETALESVSLRETKEVEPEAKAILSWDELEPITRHDFLKMLSNDLVLGDSQRLGLDVFFATYVANMKMDGRPVWLLLVGPPGCGKTMPMMALRSAPMTLMISAFRPASLISGWGIKGGTDVSLMPKLNGKMLVVKDMSSLMSQNKEVVAEIMGLLRDAYDGACSRAFGTGVERSYEVRFGFIGATTPDIDASWGLNQRLGERFIRLRLRSTLAQVYEKIDRSLETVGQEDATDGQLEFVSLRYLKHLLREDSKMPFLSMQKQIGRLAQLGAILRTAVARQAFTNQILVVPEYEEATRYAKQLAKLALALAYIRDKPTNGVEEFENIKQIVRDSLDGRLERIMQIVYFNPGCDINFIAQQLALPEWTVRFCLSDLEVSRIVTKTRVEYNLEWYFVPWLEGQIKEFKLWDKPVKE